MMGEGKMLEDILYANISFSDLYLGMLITALVISVFIVFFWIIYCSDALFSSFFRRVKNLIVRLPGFLVAVIGKNGRRQPSSFLPPPLLGKGKRIEKDGVPKTKYFFSNRPRKK
jgi:hypothetical protein